MATNELRLHHELDDLWQVRAYDHLSLDALMIPDTAILYLAEADAALMVIWPAMNWRGSNPRSLSPRGEMLRKSYDTRPMLGDRIREISGRVCHYLLPHLCIARVTGLCT